MDKAVIGLAIISAFFAFLPFIVGSYGDSPLAAGKKGMICTGVFVVLALCILVAIGATSKMYVASLVVFGCLLAAGWVAGVVGYGTKQLLKGAQRGREMMELDADRLL